MWKHGRGKKCGDGFQCITAGVFIRIFPSVKALRSTSSWPPQRCIQNISSMNEEGRKEGRNFSLMLCLLLALLATFLLSIYYVQSHSPSMPHLVLVATLGTIIIHPHFIDEENETPNRLSNLPISEATTRQSTVS